MLIIILNYFHYSQNKVYNKLWNGYPFLCFIILVIAPFELHSNNKENTENLLKLYMLYDLTNNLSKELEIINKIKNLT